MARTRILLVVPVFQSIYPRPFANFLAMALNAAVNEGARYQIDVRVPERELLHSAMNRSAALVLEHDHEAMILADDDCFPPYDAISRLLRHFEDGRDIVSGVGIMRNYPFTTTAGRYFAEGMSMVRDERTDAIRLSGFKWLDRIDTEPPGLVPVDFAGFPITLISRRALARIPAPWFGTSLDGGECTHDVYFGTKAGRAGIQMFVDREISCGHLTDAPVITPETRHIARLSLEQADAILASQRQAGASA